MNRSFSFTQKYLKFVSFLYIILFVYTATSKLIHIEQFHVRVAKMPFISEYSSLIAWSVPAIEILIAGLFLFPKYILSALYSSFSLMSIFTVYIIIVLRYSDSIPCSCGGVISTMSWKEHISFNCGFIALSLIGILLIQKNKKYVTN